MVIMASIARFAAARSGSFSAAIKARGTICQKKPQRSLHQLPLHHRPTWGKRSKLGPISELNRGPKKQGRSLRPGRAKDFMMGIDKPFHRTIRSHIPSPNAGYSAWAYIRDKEYAQNPANYLRAYFIIQGDFEKLCEYIEPSPESLTTYSYRIHELLMRICIEVEANFKAILSENINSIQQLGMGVYRKIDVTHHLSSYELILPTWHGPRRLIKPFDSWLGPNGFGTGKSPEWYAAYNASKHDRHEAFKQSNMKQLIDALAGLLVVLSSQFRTQTFSAASDALSTGSSYHELEPATGSLFRIRFPNDWGDSEKYDFDWSKLSQEAVRFSKIDYDQINVQ